MNKIYVAIPYTNMEESGYEQANMATADIMRKGYNPFSPITHSHPLTEYEVPGNWDFWSQIDMDWIDVCDEVWVIIPREGIDMILNSTGVQAEITYADENNIPVKAFEYVNGILTESNKTIREKVEV